MTASGSSMRFVRRHTYTCSWVGIVLVAMAVLVLIQLLSTTA